MAAQQTTPRSMTSIAGAFLLAAGFLMLFSNLDAAATRIAYTTGNTVLETLPSLILAGALLLRDVFREGFPAYKPGAGSSDASGANA